ncbi:TspO and MBR-like protein [Blastocladiella britannica]|nr:TspO and MBR-like protein [Blastocladiella britannica]
MVILSTLAGRLDAGGLHSAGSLGLFISVPVLTGFASALSMGNATKTWYKTDLKKPSWTPPPWVFGPVWTTLYATMGYASHRIFHLVPRHLRAVPLALYAGQLALNFAWTPIFFQQQRFGVATAVITGLWGSIAATAWTFAEYDAPSGWLLVPYLGWVSYASALTAWIWRNNPGFRHRQLKKKGN